MEQTWLEFTTDQIVTVGLVILGGLIVLPVVFGALVYSIMALWGRVNEMRRTRSRDHTQQEE